MQEAIEAARISRRSSFTEIDSFISEDLQIDTKLALAAGSPIIGLILNADSHRSNRGSPLYFDTDDGDDEDFEFEFPIFDRKLLSGAEQIQTGSRTGKRSSGNGKGGSEARGTRSIRRWGVSLRDMWNWRERSGRKASWFVRMVSTKKTVEEGSVKRRGNNSNTSSYLIVRLGLFHRT